MYFQWLSERVPLSEILLFFGEKIPRIKESVSVGNHHGICFGSQGVEVENSYLLGWLQKSHIIKYGSTVGTFPFGKLSEPVLFWILKWRLY
jgi:hypothetical protein